MNRILKFIATLLVGVVFLGVAAAVLLPHILDPDKYRDEIAKLLYDKSGLQLDIQGPVNWSIFPWVGLSLENISVTGAHNDQLGQLGVAQVGVKLLPLLSERVEMQTVRLKGLELTLVRDAQGVGNWQVKAPQPSSGQVKTTPSPEQTQKPAPQPSPEKAPGANDSPALTIDIAGIDVSDLLISYNDQLTGQSYTISDASLTTGAIATGQSFPFQLKAHIAIPELAMYAQVGGNMTVDLDTGNYDIKGLKISATPDVTNGERLSIVGNVQYHQSPLQIAGDLNVEPFNLASLLAQLKIPLSPVADPDALTRLSFDSHFSSDGDNLSANRLALKLDDFSLDGTLNMDQKGKTQFTFTGNDLNLDNYLPPSVADDGQPADTDKPSADRQSAIEEGDADAPVAQQKPAQAGTSGPTTREAPLLPEAMLRKLNLDGSLKLNSLTVAGFVFEQPALTLHAAGGRQRVQIGSGFYQGTIDMTNSLDVRQAGNPQLAASASLDNITLAALATRLPELASLQGEVDASMNVTTNGQYASVLTQNLNGEITFKVDKGAFTGTNFDHLLCQAIASVRKKTLLKTDDWGTTTEFRDLSGTMNIDNGVATGDNLIAALANMNLKGDGYINLVDRKLDYHFGLNIPGGHAPGNDPACEVSEEFADVTWPVQCYGEFGDLKCGIDLERVTRTVAEITQNRLKQKFEEKVQEPVKKLFQGLFNQ